VLSKSNIENPTFQEVIAVAWRNLGLIEMYDEKGQYDKARCYLRESRRIMKARGERRGIARTEGALGLLYQKHGKYRVAQKYLESALSFNQADQNSEGVVMNLVDLGEVARRQGNLPRARALFEKARFIAQKNKGHDRYAYVLLHLARLQKDYGKLPEALALAEEANRIYASLGAKYWEDKAEVLLTELRNLGISARAEAPVIGIEEFSTKIQGMVQEFREQEKLHRNSPEKYLAIAPRIYDHILSVGQDALLDLPLSFQLEITNQCNTRCVMCSRWTWAKECSRQELSTEIIKKFLEDLSPNYQSAPRSITISGGEPLCHPDFIEILKHAKYCGWKVGILTNGIDISEEAAEAIVQNAEWVRVSIDASDEKRYRGIRRPIGAGKSWANLERTFRRLRSAQAKYSAGCRIGGSYTIQEQNIKHIEDMLAVFHQRFLLIIDSLLVFKFAHGPHGQGKFLCSEPNLEEFRAKFLGSSLPDGAFNFPYLERFMEEYSSVHDIAAGRPLQTFYGEREITCFTPYLFSLIDAFGDVYPCCFLYEDNQPYIGEAAKVREEFRMGNIQESSFRGIWNSEKYRAFRLRMQPIMVDKARGGIPQCAECTRHYLPNYFLTSVYEFYKKMAFTCGGERAATDLREIVAGYPPGVVWF
jgi:MoaA/NifB/PqqE/SkfB family radical SAM enzyme